MISLVTGTFNRLPQLQNMVNSARAASNPNLLREIIIVDGGSSDGTQKWCKQQPDVKLIEHKALLGAIKAFCDGAKAATGDYVLLANDDVVFEPDSITRAAVYLETHPTCGAVAFADNRATPGYDDGFKVQMMDAKSADGLLVDAVPYAQVGLFRRWLGDLCGWWGADDYVMKYAHTYGGDNFLSARIWEYGYTVDPVDGCQVDDLVHEDGLRDHNLVEEQKRSGTYYRRFPGGVYIGWRDEPDNPQREAMRILYLPLYEPGYGHYKTGLRDALAKVGHVWEYDYQADGGQQLARLVATWQPHLMLTQIHSANDLPETIMQQAREYAPEMVVVNWNGDVYPDGLVSQDMLSFLQHVDLQLVVNGDVLPVYAQQGIHAAYWQIGFEPVDYDRLPDATAHDVVFLGNCYSDARQELAAFLKRQPYNVGIYGRGWDHADGDTLYNFTAGAAIYTRAKIAIGDNQWTGKGFVSNRLFEALASGVLVMHQRIPALEELTGLQDGVHYVMWHDLPDLDRKLDQWLSPAMEHERLRIVKAGRDFVHQYHSFDARVTQLFEDILPMIQKVIA